MSDSTPPRYGEWPRGAFEGRERIPIHVCRECGAHYTGSTHQCRGRRIPRRPEVREILDGRR